jgi:hypothetical protein
VLQEPEKSKENLDKAEKILGDLDSVEPSVNAGLYGVGADYYKVCRNLGGAVEVSS